MTIILHLIRAFHLSVIILHKLFVTLSLKKVL